MDRGSNGQNDPEAGADRASRAVFLPWRWRDYQDRPALLDKLHRLGLSGTALARPALQAQTLRRVDRGVAIAGHAKSAQVVTGVPPGAEIPVDWTWSSEGKANNPVVPYEGSTGRLLMGGALAEPVRPCDPR